MGHTEPAATYARSRQERYASIVRVWPSLLLIFLVLALRAPASPRPGSRAVGALLAAIIGAIFHSLTAADSVNALKNTIRTSAMIFLILIGATIFGTYMALSHIPQEVVTLVTAMQLNRWVVIAELWSPPS